MTHSFRLSIYLDFTDSIDFYSVHPKMKNDFMQTVNLLSIEGAIEGRRIKQFIDFIITFLIKSLKKSYLLFNLFHHDYNAKKD